MPKYLVFCDSCKQQVFSNKTKVLCEPCKEIKALKDKVERYEKALKEIAKETGTPYAEIAIKALEVY